MNQGEYVGPSKEKKIKHVNTRCAHKIHNMNIKREPKKTEARRKSQTNQNHSNKPLNISFWPEKKVTKNILKCVYEVCASFFL